MLTFRAMVDESDCPDISRLLMNWSNGDQESLNELVATVYPQVRRMARQQLNARPADVSLQSAAVANELYLKLVRAGGIRCEDRLHFFALCAQMIRRLLVDHARSRMRAKRGGPLAQVPLEEELIGTRARGIEMLALDEALVSLSKIDARKSRVVELRYFAGLSTEQIAELLNISPETVQRDWKMAKTWLLRELSAKPK